MHACQSREDVIKSLRHLFVKVRGEGVARTESESIRVILFREFRTLLLKDLRGTKRLTDTGRFNVLPPQREAMFLKFHGGFRYREVATIMQISIRSASDLVSQGIALHREISESENVLDYI
jgi:hypothetical protein